MIGFIGRQTVIKPSLFHAALVVDEGKSYNGSIHASLAKPVSLPRHLERLKSAIASYRVIFFFSFFHHYTFFFNTMSNNPDIPDELYYLGKCGIVQS